MVFYHFDGWLIFEGCGVVWCGMAWESAVSKRDENGIQNNSRFYYTMAMAIDVYIVNIVDLPAQESFAVCSRQSRMTSSA